MPKLVDTVLNSNVFASRALANAKRFRGEQHKFPVKVSKNTTGQSFQGYDTFSTNASDTRQNLAFDPAFYQISVSLPLDELSVNSGAERVLDLMGIETASSAQDMADDIGTLFYGDGTGNGGKDFLGLEAIVDDGSNAATFGGLSRTTYSTLNSTVTASGGTLTLAKMATLWNAAASGSQRPTAAYCDETVWSLYEQLLEPKLRIQKNVGLDKKGLASGTGFTGLDYKGMPVLADEKATAQTMYFLNEDFIDWLALPMAKTMPINFASQNIEGNDYSAVKGLGFSWSDWIKPSNAAAVIGHVYLGGNLVSSNPKRHAKLTGLTTV
jgi:hypothetical protein